MCFYLFFFVVVVLVVDDVLFCFVGNSEKKDDMNLPSQGLVNYSAVLRVGVLGGKLRDLIKETIMLPISTAPLKMKQS